jgi:biotin carboxylase
MESLCGKRLLLLGGNNVIDEISDFTKKNEIVLISAGNVPKANIHRISAEQNYVDVTDAEKMKVFLAEKKIDGIFSCSGEEVIRKSLDYINECGYKYFVTRKQWDILMNKSNFKKYSAKYGIPTIPEYNVDFNTGKPKGNIKFPLIVKPADNGGSFGITVCTKPDELFSAIVYARNNSFVNQILVEKFLNGPYFQFEIYIKDGIKYLAYTKGRIFYDAQEGCPAQPFMDIYPSESEDLIKENLFPKVALLLGDIGVNNGSVMFQGIIENGVPYIMDVAFRLSGGMDYRVVQKEKGINIIANYMQYALTGKWGDDISGCDRAFSKHYATICIGLKNGIIEEITGIDDIKSSEYVYAFYQYYNAGDEMKYSGRFLQTLCRVFFFGDDMDDIYRKAENIIHMLNVTDKNGNSLLLAYHF